MPIERYPHPGYPIAPACLRPILRISLPPFFSRLSTTFKTLAELDHRVWAYVTDIDARQLSQFVLARVAAMRQHSVWRETSFPTLPTMLHVSDLRLERRTYNCLTRSLELGYFKNISELSSYTLDELLTRIYAFGLKSMVDLLTSVDFIQPEQLSDKPWESTPLLVSHRVLTREEVAQIVNNPKDLRHFNGHYLPLLPIMISLQQLNVSVRTHGCISAILSSGEKSPISELSQLRVGQLLALKNFGRTSMIDLLTKVLPLMTESVEEQNPPAGALVATVVLSDKLTQAAERLMTSRFAKRVRCGDLRLSKDLGFLLHLANKASDEPSLPLSASMYDIAQRLVSRVRDPQPVDDAVARISELRRKIAAMVRMKLESELASIASARLEGKKLRIAMRYLGWLGDVPLTLQATGDEFGITRERVRQISSPVVELLRRGRTFSPRLEEAIRFVARLVPGEAEEIELGLQTASITRSLFRVESIINAASLVGRPLTFTIDQSRSPRLIVDQDNVLLEESILKLATRSVSKYGLCNISDLSERMSETARAGIGDKLILSVLRRSASYIDLGQGWFWLGNVSRNHLCTLIRKMLALAPRLHVSEIRAGLVSDPRGMGFAPPKSAVLTFCQSALGCLIDEQDFVCATETYRPAEVLSETEMIAFNVLQERGPLLHRIEFEKLCVERGMNPITFNIYLTRSPIVARYAPSIYGLRGAVFSPSDIDKLTIPRATERFSDHGWTDTAQPWIALEVTPSMLSTGITHVPAGFNELIIGRYVLKTDQGTELGRLVISERAAWGLGPLFRRYGGEVGDVLVLTFDICKHQVTARIGEKKTVLPEIVWSVEEIERREQA